MTDVHEYIFSYQDGKYDTFADKKQPVILVIEDEQEVRTFIIENIGSGYNIIEAADEKNLII